MGQKYWYFLCEFNVSKDTIAIRYGIILFEIVLIKQYEVKNENIAPFFNKISSLIQDLINLNSTVHYF